MKKFFIKNSYFLLGIFILLSIPIFDSFYKELEFIDSFLGSVFVSFLFLVHWDKITNLRIDEIENCISPPSGEDK